MLYASSLEGLKPNLHITWKAELHIWAIFKLLNPEFKDLNLSRTQQTAPFCTFTSYRGDSRKLKSEMSRRAKGSAAKKQSFSLHMVWTTHNRCKMRQCIAQSSKNSTILRHQFLNMPMVQKYIPKTSLRMLLLNISNSDLHLDTRFNGDRCDLLDHFRWAVQINHSLVHSQFEPVPCVRSCTIIKFNKLGPKTSQNLKDVTQCTHRRWTCVCNTILVMFSYGLHKNLLAYFRPNTITYLLIPLPEISSLKLYGTQKGSTSWQTWSVPHGSSTHLWLHQTEDLIQWLAL